MNSIYNWTIDVYQQTYIKNEINWQTYYNEYIISFLQDNMNYEYYELKAWLPPVHDKPVD